MDDNGALLYHARGGITLDQLNAHGIAPCRSRLALLKAYQLISIEDDLISTSFPVVGPEVLSALRPRTLDLANNLVPAISDDIARICAELRTRGHCGYEYAVVFGHIIDGMLWDYLKANGMAPTTELSIERPFWNGTFWAIYPGRPGTAGVDELRGPNATMVMVWTDATLRALRELSRSSALQALLDDPTGQSELPVLAAGEQDAINRSGSRIVSTLADALRSSGPARELLDAIPDADRQQRVVILAHELIWDLMQMLVAAGHLALPAGMRGTAPTSESVVTQLFIVHR